VLNWKGKLVLLLLVVGVVAGHFALKSGFASTDVSDARSQWSWVLTSMGDVGGVIPAPSTDVCADCNGDGFVGDGKIRVDCDTCNGTGKVTSLEAWSFVSSRKAEACADGACSSGSVIAARPVRRMIADRKHHPVRFVRNKLRCR
jgi:hypothetical protein